MAYIRQRTSDQLYDSVVYLEVPPATRMTRAQYERLRRNFRRDHVAVLAHGDPSRLSKLENRKPCGAAFAQRVAKLYGIQDPRDLFEAVTVELRIVENEDGVDVPHGTSTDEENSK